MQDRGTLVFREGPRVTGKEKKEGKADHEAGLGLDRGLVVLRTWGISPEDDRYSGWVGIGALPSGLFLRFY